MPDNSQNFNDLNLLNELAGGSHRAYESLFRSYYTDLCRFCSRYVRNPDISEEIVQEVFIYIWEKRTALNITASFKAYLYTAVRNKSINYLKLQLPRDQAKEDITKHEVPSTIDLEGDVKYRELEGKVSEAINLLPKKCGIIFDLSRNAGHTYKEIAEELEISVKTVENQMVIALRKLRESLAPYIDGDR